MNNEVSQFHNALRILLNLDSIELREGGVTDENWGTPAASHRNQVLDFSRDPIREALRMPDANFERLYALIQSQQPGNTTSPAPSPLAVPVVPTVPATPEPPTAPKPQPIEKVWVVWDGCTSSAPMYKRTSKESAVSEAKRIAARSPAKPFLIMESIGAFITPAVEPQAIELTDPKPINDDDIPF